MTDKMCRGRWTLSAVVTCAMRLSLRGGHARTIRGSRANQTAARRYTIAHVNERADRIPRELSHVHARGSSPVAHRRQKVAAHVGRNPHRHVPEASSRHQDAPEVPASPPTGTANQHFVPMNMALSSRMIHSPEKKKKPSNIACDDRPCLRLPFCGCVSPARYRRRRENCATNQTRHHRRSQTARMSHREPAVPQDDDRRLREILRCRRRA